MIFLEILRERCQKFLSYQIIKYILVVYILAIPDSMKSKCFSLIL